MSSTATQRAEQTVTHGAETWTRERQERERERERETERQRERERERERERREHRQNCYQLLLLSAAIANA
jgi:hypothetical protein